MLDLFSGIGGFSLGLERAGMRTIAFCEVDPYCRAVLARHWPDVPIHGDIRTLDAAGVAAYADRAEWRAQRGACDGLARQDGIPQREEGADRPRGSRASIDLICGGFPCQPFSAAGKRRGTQDDRHLWPQMARVISEVRPAWVVGENVAGLVKLGLDGVLSDLEGLGYAVWPVVLPACAVDAPHRRDRVWIVAHTPRHEPGRQEQRPEREQIGECGQPQPTRPSFCEWFSESSMGGMVDGLPSELDGWLPEPDIPRVAKGVPHKVQRLRALQNAVVPAVVEQIGRAIMQAEGLAA